MTTLLRRLPRAVAALALAAMPGLAAASGGDILLLFWLELGLFVAVIASLLLLPMSARRKLGVFAAYFAAAVVAFVATNDIPYSQNAFMVNAICVGVPLVAWLLALVASGMRR